MNKRDLDRALESVFQRALELTAEQERGLHRRILASRQEPGAEWEAFTQVMIGLRARFQTSLPNLSQLSRQPYAPGWGSPREIRVISEFGLHGVRPLRMKRGAPQFLLNWIISGRQNRKKRHPRAERWEGANHGRGS